MSVATKMPHTMGQGLRKRAAKTKDKSCVLSPISARATIPVERRNASMSPSYRPRQTKFGAFFALFWCVLHKQGICAPNQFKNK
jgi:hypothetical protein